MSFPREGIPHWAGSRQDYSVEPNNSGRVFYSPVTLGRGSVEQIVPLLLLDGFCVPLLTSFNPTYSLEKNTNYESNDGRNIYLCLRIYVKSKNRVENKVLDAM